MFNFDICDFQRLDEIMKRTRKTDGSNKVDLVFDFNSIKQHIFSF